MTSPNQRALLLLAGGVIFTISGPLSAQAQSKPDENAAHPTEAARGTAPKMKVTELGPSARTFQVILSRGDEVMAGLTEFAEKYNIQTCHFTAVGAMDSAVVGWYDPEKRAFKRNEINGEVEVVSLIGSITRDSKGKANAHAHVVVALSDGGARAGHLIEGHVSLTMQIYAIDTSAAVPAKASN